MAYSSGAFSAFFFSSPSTRLVRPARIFASTGLCCSISRLMLSGRSSLSTTPFRKRSQAGTRSLASSVMKTRRTYSLMPWGRSGWNRSNGGVVGTNTRLAYSMTPSTRLCRVSHGESKACATWW